MVEENKTNCNWWDFSIENFQLCMLGFPGVLFSRGASHGGGKQPFLKGAGVNAL